MLLALDRLGDGLREGGLLTARLEVGERPGERAVGREEVVHCGENRRGHVRHHRERMFAFRFAAHFLQEIAALCEHFDSGGS